jgi:hypothetical protein
MSEEEKIEQVRETERPKELLAQTYQSQVFYYRLLPSPTEIQLT